MTPSQHARRALDLVQEDGEWPSPGHESAPEARRASAMQEAIDHLANAVLILGRAQTPPTPLTFTRDRLLYLLEQSARLARSDSSASVIEIADRVLGNLENRDV